MIRESQSGEWVSASGTVLVWQIKEDKRPLYVESAILCLKIGEGKTQRWKLSHVFRHPREDPHRKWTIDQVDDAPQVGETAGFAKSLTLKDATSFLKNTWWHFEPDPGWRVIDAAVCKSAWKQCFHSEPPVQLLEEAEKWRGKEKKEE
jgi:hypothetical protein